MMEEMEIELDMLRHSDKTLRRELEEKSRIIDELLGLEDKQPSTQHDGADTAVGDTSQTGADVERASDSLEPNCTLDGTLEEASTKKVPPSVSRIRRAALRARTRKAQEDRPAEDNESMEKALEGDIEVVASTPRSSRRSTNQRRRDRIDLPE